MATITSLGSGSGLDLESLVTQLMSVEKRPLTALQKQESSFNVKISALATLSSKLSALQTSAKDLVPSATQTAQEKFATYSATVAKAEIATATASTGAVTGSYALEISELAQGQKLTSSVISGALSTGTLTLSVGDMTGAGGTFAADADRTFNITIDSSNNTLTGLRNAINSAKTGVTASIVNGTAGAQLILTGESGSSQVFKLDGIAEVAFDPDLPAANANMSRTQVAQGASFSINGIAATSNSNTVTGVLEGVTINLLAKTAANTPTTLTIARESTTKLKSALDSFITAYNDAASTMTTQGAYDPTTKIAGSLQGNRVLREAQSSMRSLLYTTSLGGTSSYQHLSDIGVSLGANGKLAIDSSKLEAALAADPSSVAALAAKVGKAYDTSMDRLAGTAGSVKIATDSMKASITDLDKRQEALQLRLVTIEARYRKQFTTLDTLMSGMSSISNYLTQNLSRLA